MTAVFIGSKCSKIKFYWPASLRNTGMIIVGYSIGLSFTKTALLQIMEKLPSMLITTVLLILFCAGIAYVVAKITSVDYPTVLTGSIPGGLSQMIIFAEEMKGIDITTVTFLQVARLMMIIFFVPFLILGPFFKNTTHAAAGLAANGIQPVVPLFPLIIPFAIICVLFAFFAKKLRFPTPFMLGPILITAIVNVCGIHGPFLNTGILDLSQFMIGGYIGLLLNPEKLEHKARIISLALLSGLVMIVGSIGLSLLLVFVYHISPSTSFLSVAPGGMDQMGILASEVHADLSMVSGYQIFRLFFIYFAVPPLLRWLFKVSRKRTSKVA